MMVVKQSRLRNLKQEQEQAEVDSVLPELLIRRLRESLVGLGVPLYRAAHDGFQWGTGLGLSGTSGTVSDRRAGRNIPIYWSEVDLAGYRTLSRYLCDTNGFAIGFLGRLTDYHIRKGYGWQACLRGEKKGAYATVAGKPTDPLLQKAQQVLDTWRDANQWPMRSREGFRRWRRDGEVFGRFFHGGWDRLPAFRFVGPEQIGSPDGDTSTHKSYGIHSDPHDIETRYEYFIRDPNGTGGPDGEWVSADRIIHAKCNVDSEIKRGIPDFFPLAEQLDGVRDLMRNMIVTAARQAAVAWREKFPAQTMQSVMSMPLGYQNTGQTTTARTAAQSALDMLPIWLGNAVGYGVNRFPPGSVVKVEGDREYEPGPTFQGVPNFVQVEQAVLRGCGARWGMPEYFSGDASNNNFASSLVSGSPFANAVEGTQLEWGCIWEKPIALAVLRFAAESGFFTEQEYRRLDVEVIEPAVISPQPDKDTNMFSVWAQNKWASKDTIRMKLGLDPQHEAEGVRKDEEEEKRQQQPPPPLAGGGGSPASPFPPAPGGGSIFGESTGDNQRQDGEVWQGDSGKWFTKIDGHVQPTKAPGGDETVPQQAGDDNSQNDARAKTRTPEFKAWFGDWENDPANASKVVNNDGDPTKTLGTGKPVKVYHGTTAEFDTFDTDKAGKNAAHVGPGFYFSEDVDIAKTFTGSDRNGKLIEAYLNIKKPLDFDSVPTADDLNQWAVMVQAANPKAKASAFLKEIASQADYEERDLTAFDVWKIAASMVGRDGANKIVLSLGHDGITHISADSGGTVRLPGAKSSWGRVWIAFHPNQIKSVDNKGTFRADSDNIYESEERPDNVPWQGESGKWFVKKNGRTVPAKAPGSDKGGKQRQPKAQPATGTAAVQALNDSITDPRVKDYIDSALYNATDEGVTDPKLLASSLAYGFKIAFEKNEQDSIEAITTALSHVGAWIEGKPGSTIEFIGAMFTSDVPIFTGDSAVIVRPAVVQRLETGDKVWMKGIVKPA